MSMHSPVPLGAFLLALDCIVLHMVIVSTHAGICNSPYLPSGLTDSILIYLVVRHNRRLQVITQLNSMSSGWSPAHLHVIVEIGREVAAPATRSSAHTCILIAYTSRPGVQLLECLCRVPTRKQREMNSPGICFAEGGLGLTRQLCQVHTCKVLHRY